MLQRNVPRLFFTTLLHYYFRRDEPIAEHIESMTADQVERLKRRGLFSSVPNFSVQRSTAVCGQNGPWWFSFYQTRDIPEALIQGIVIKVELVTELTLFCNPLSADTAPL